MVGKFLRFGLMTTENLEQTMTNCEYYPSARFNLWGQEANKGSKVSSRLSCRVLLVSRFGNMWFEAKSFNFETEKFLPCPGRTCPWSRSQTPCCQTWSGMTSWPGCRPSSPGRTRSCCRPGWNKLSLKLRCLFLNKQKFCFNGYMP